MPGAEQGKISQPHYFKKVVEGVLHGPQALKYALVAILVVLGASHFIQSLDSLSLHHQYRNIYRKDLLQDYLLAKALLAGDNPYLPLPELARRFMEPLPHQIFPHPSPHPPPVALFLLPLGLLPYKAAAVVWFWAEIAFLLLTVWVLVRWASGQVTVRRVAFGAALMFCFTPFFQEVVLGQLMLPVLVCLTLAWHLLRSGKDFWGGIFLGVAM